MRIGIVQFPGSNCERETCLAVKRAGMDPVECLWNEPEERLAQLDGYILVGGFSYQDRSRAGVIAAALPIMQVIREQSERGKPVLGICNGAQILVETGMVPGFSGYPVSVALTNNKRVQAAQVLGTGFYNTWTHLKLASSARRSAWIGCFSSDTLISVPLAHGEGRFIMPKETLAKIEAAGLVVFQYCDPDGQVLDEFPVNPNGSMANIAAICNPFGNVMAMMPHPERTSNGDAVFHAMRAYLESGPSEIPNDAWIEHPKIDVDLKPFQTSPASYQFMVAQVISDDEAISVEAALKNRGLALSLKRFAHWEVRCASKSILHQIQASGILYNERKEFVLEPTVSSDKQRVLLVRPRENLSGLKKQQQLQKHFDIEGIDELLSGVIWVIEAAPEHLDAVVTAVIESTMLFNPFSHEGYLCY